MSSPNADAADIPIAEAVDTSKFVFGFLTCPISNIDKIVISQDEIIVCLHEPYPKNGEIVCSMRVRNPYERAAWIKYFEKHQLKIERAE